MSEPASPTTPATRSISSQAIVVSLLSAGGILTSLLINMAIAYFYGASHERDAYLLASVIPLYMSSVFSGTLSLLFVPMFIERRAREPGFAWRTASSLVTLSGIALLALCLIVGLFASEIASALGTASPERTSLTSSLLLLLLPSTVFSSLASLFSSLHYAERRFILPALGPIISGVITLAVTASLDSRLGIHALAAATSAGALASCLILACGLLSPTRLSLRFRFRDVHLGEIARTALPLALASLLYRFNPGFERIIGASLPPGSISFVAYASQMILVLATITTTGITTTIFPLLAEGWATRDLAAVRRYFGIAVRSILLLSLPLSVYVGVFSGPLVRMLLERGAFRAEDTAAVATCINLLLAGFIAANVGNVVTRCIYATQRTHALAAYTVFETALYVCIAVVFSGWLSYAGLALATSVRDVISACVYFWMASTLFGGLAGRRLLLDGLKVASATACMLLILVAVRVTLDGRMHYMVAPIAGGSLGFLAYAFLAIRLFRIEEAIRFIDMLPRDISSALRRPLGLR